MKCNYSSAKYIRSFLTVIDHIMTYHLAVGVKIVQIFCTNDKEKATAGKPYWYARYDVTGRDLHHLEPSRTIF